MDISEHTPSDHQAVEAPTSHLESDNAEFGVSKFRWVPISPKLPQEPRPIPEITAEIRRDMDNLCNWLHEVQRLHTAMMRLRAERREAQSALPSAES